MANLPCPLARADSSEFSCSAGFVALLVLEYSYDFSFRLVLNDCTAFQWQRDYSTIILLQLIPPQQTPLHKSQDLA